jgi:hypothetical protein
MGVGLIGEEGFGDGDSRTANLQLDWTDWMDWTGPDWLGLAWAVELGRMDILSLAARLRKNDTPTYLPKRMEYSYI